MSYKTQSNYVFYSFLLLKNPRKTFHSIYLFFLLFSCTQRKVVCLSSQLLFKTPNKTLKFQEKIIKKMHFTAICRPKFQVFPSVSTMGSSRRATEITKKEGNWIFGENGCTQKCFDKAWQNMKKKKKKKKKKKELKVTSNYRILKIIIIMVVIYCYRKKIQNLETSCK